MLWCDSGSLPFSRRFVEDNEQEQCQDNDHPAILLGLTGEATMVACPEITLRSRDRMGKEGQQRKGTSSVTRERGDHLLAGKNPAITSQGAYLVSTPFYG